MTSSSICSADLAMHANYSRLVEKAERSHGQHRSPEGIEAFEITLARLYCHAFRLHTIGAFHATRLALEECLAEDSVVDAFRLRATETLLDMGNQSMEAVPEDFRAVVATFYRYHQGIMRVLDSFRRIDRHASLPAVRHIERHFRQAMELITSECGIHLTQDTKAPEQASFVVPKLGITIVPLVYGDHHSWNLAYLAGTERNVPIHRHHHGVEIHLGYKPTHGMTVLGNCRAMVNDGYAMPIPPHTDHGWVNTSDDVHHVPFIFGSLIHGGWGVFLDVEPQTGSVEDLRLVDRDSAHFSQMVHLEREIEQSENVKSCLRRTLIPFSVTNRQGSGGLELSIARINQSGYSYPVDDFRILSVARGEGQVVIDGIQRAVRPHDHFGVPAGMKAMVRQTGDNSLVVLDCTIKGVSRRGRDH